MIRNRELFNTVALLAFLAGGLLLVWAGVLPMWAWNLLTLITIAARVITRLDRYTEELSITDQGVTRKYGSRFRKQMSEYLSWDQISRVEAISHETGAQKKDALLLLYGLDGSGVAVPAPLAQKHDLLGQLRPRLPGFRDDELARALAASERQTFVLWEQGQSSTPLGT